MTDLICDKIKVYIYGDGLEYGRLISYLSLYPKVLIEGILNKEKKLYKYMDGIPCYTAEEADFGVVDYVIVANEKWRPIAEYLGTLKCEESKIIWSWVFSVPYFDFDKYITIRKGKITILSRNCLGGFVYRDLGMKALSPTKNCMCFRADWYEFVENYQRYLNCDMEVYDKNTHGMYQGNLGNQFMEKGIIDSKILWDFNHARDIRVAVTEWNRRRENANLDNIAVIDIITNDKELEMFDKIKINKKVGLYYKETDVKNVVFFPEWLRDSEVRIKNAFSWSGYTISECSMRGGNPKIDWIKFLDEEPDFIRY